MLESSQAIQGTFNLFLAIYQSKPVLVLKFALAIYLAVVIVDVVLLLISRGLSGDWRVVTKGMNIPTVSPGAMQKRWNKILARLESGNPSQYKVAVLEADTVADEILAGIGYKGANMGERLANINPDHLETLPDLVKAHQVRNKIVYEAGFQIDRETAAANIKIFEETLRRLEYL